MTKLTSDNIVEIERLFQTGLSMGSLARQFGVCTATISKYLVRAGLWKPHKLRKLSDDNVQKICLQYNAGETTTSIALDLGVAPPTISRWLKANDIERRGCQKLSDRDIDRICELYRLHENAAEIARQYNVDPKTIYYHLSKHNVKINRYTYTIDNKNFFHQIDSERKAYWVGLLMADGCIVEHNNSIQLGLVESDRPIIQAFLDDIGANHPIHTKHDGRPNRRPFVSIQITAPTLIKDLAKYGVIPRKTFRLKWPALIPDIWIHHFMRGYVDGDGGFYAYQKKGYKTYVYYFAVSSACRLFLTDFRLHLSRACDLAQPRLMTQKGHSTLSLNYCGRLQVKRIFDYLYQDATVWLPRKREKIEPYF